MPINQAVVLLGFREAKVFLLKGFMKNDVEIRFIHDRSLIRSCDGQKGKGTERHDFFRDVVRSLDRSLEWLILGNRSSCFGLLMYICHQNLESRVVGVEPIDMPTDADVLSRARDYFAKHDEVVAWQQLAEHGSDC
ncbi:hypothetical protein [Mesorhizobium sp. Root172]|jgi:hypothetical protein|uniref:hypothetical protein n=1 Tax=Mesorhizobium sp. Root172 TaxID=1736481 RepID=UPI0006F23936|nr:hypothetical protein [Mesorhizobium sp. Root172]KRB30854.1 hypothetical protein ASE05_29400 [Mesorhizobium sp. Root172]